MSFSAMLLVLCVQAPGASAVAPAYPNLLKNAGFESVKDKQPYLWSSPKYWSGELEPVTDKPGAHGGSRVLKMTAEKTRGKHWGRVLQGGLRVRPGDRYRFSLWAKGKGELLLGVIRYTTRRDDKPYYHYLWQPQTTALSDQWRQLVFEFTLMNPDVRSLAVCPELRGEGAEALIDDAELRLAPPSGVSLTAAPGCLMTVAGQAAPVTLRLLKDGKPAASVQLSIAATSPDGKPTTAKVRTDAAGQAAYPFSVPADAEPGVHQAVASDPATGAACAFTVAVLDPAEYAAFEKATAKAKLAPLPAHILIIGDSLSDQMRGSNYVDKFCAWLQRKHPGQVTFRNAGVGGDYITRVWDRLSPDKKAYRQYMYDNLFEPKPTHIFIFLGHNDTKATSKSKHKTPVVLPEDEDKLLRKTIAHLKANSGAKITMLSASSSVYEICKARTDKREAAGKPSTLFGKPELLEQYNTIARKAAADLGADYLDVYEPTRAYPDKPSLFTPDGVHLSAKGHGFIALKILEYLGRD